MDFAEPLQALIPGATGRVLAVLVQTSMPLSGRAIAELGGVSSAQGARVLQRLVELGVVQGRSAPPAILYSLARDHVAAEPLLTLGSLPAKLTERLAEKVASLEPSPACVGTYGSFARHEARTDSDIDVLVVRPKDVQQDDDDWASVVEVIRDIAGRISGNRVEILEVGQTEIPRLIVSRRPLWREIARDFLLIYGTPLQDL